MSTQAKAAEEEEEAAPRATLNVPQSTHCQPGKLYVERERGRRRSEESGGCLAVILFNVNFRCAHVALGKLLVSFFMTRLISSLYRKNIDINIFECVCVCLYLFSFFASFLFLVAHNF